MFYAYQDGDMVKVHKIETNALHFVVYLRGPIQSYQLNGKYLAVCYGNSSLPEVYDCERFTRIR
jgi:hypothetical protein